MFPAPPAPSFAADQSSTTERYLRYEDCTQDGRLIPVAIPPALAGLWQTVLVHHKGARASIAARVLPILTRLTLVSHDQPIRVDRAVESHAGFELAAEPDGSRLYMNVWADMRGIAGRVRPGEAAGERIVAGQVFAEHTFTRPFAPPDQRRVTSLAGIEGYPEHPSARHTAQTPASAQEPPDGGTWLDDLARDPSHAVFALDQTDANQHVNSIVYIRVFAEAVQRRLAAASHKLTIRSKAVDIAYRKPCFAGDRIYAHVRLFEHAAGVGGAGFLASEDGKPRCYVRMAFGA